MFQTLANAPNSEENNNVTSNWPEETRQASHEREKTHIDSFAVHVTSSPKFWSCNLVTLKKEEKM
jgi:hypothetical protein